MIINFHDKFFNIYDNSVFKNDIDLHDEPLELI